MTRHLAIAAACLSLGACTMYNKPGTSPSAFDGTYSGSVTLTHSSPQGGSAPGTSGVACASPGQKDGSLTVQNGTVVWNNGGSTFYAPIRNDGAFQAQNGGTYFSGKITNRAMVARGNISGCHTVYDLTKSV